METQPNKEKRKVRVTSHAIERSRERYKWNNPDDRIRIRIISYVQEAFLTGCFAKHIPKQFHHSDKIGFTGNDKYCVWNQDRTRAWLVGKDNDCFLVITALERKKSLP